jgi:hypothetical protein
MDKVGEKEERKVTDNEMKSVNGGSSGEYIYKPYYLIPGSMGDKRKMGILPLKLRGIHSPGIIIPRNYRHHLATRYQFRVESSTV